MNSERKPHKLTLVIDYWPIVYHNISASFLISQFLSILAPPLLIQILRLSKLTLYPSIAGSNQRLLQRASHYPRRVPGHPLPGRVPFTQFKQRTLRRNHQRALCCCQRCCSPQCSTRLQGGLLWPPTPFQDVPCNLCPVQHLHQGGTEPKSSSQSSSAIPWRLPRRLRPAGQHNPAVLR